MANITKLEELKVDNIEVKNTEVHNGTETEGTVTLKLDRVSGECWGGLSWDLLFPRLGSETGREYFASQGWVEDQHFRTVPNTEFEFGLKITNLDEAIVFTHLLEGSSEPLVDWSLYTEDEDGGAIGVISYQNALKFVDQYGNEGSGRLRLDTDGITMSGTTYYNNGTLNLTNSTIEVNGNTGTAGQVLTSTGSGLEWRTPSGGGGGSIDTSNLVTLDGAQTITGDKIIHNSVGFYFTGDDSTQKIQINNSGIYYYDESVTTVAPCAILRATMVGPFMAPKFLYLPNKDGTLAVTSDVPNIYTTATGTNFSTKTLRVYTDGNGYLHIKTS